LRNCPKIIFEILKEMRSQEVVKNGYNRICGFLCFKIKIMEECLAFV